VYGGDEPFEIVFKNNTAQKIQVKLTMDGTDILTGETATTEPTKEMWVVNGYASLSLKAWPETNNGGAQLIFTSANNSVALNTHGDLSSRGIIAVAVYTEGHVEPTRLNNEYHFHNVIRSKEYYPIHPTPVYPVYPHTPVNPIWYSTSGTITGQLNQEFSASASVFNDTNYLSLNENKSLESLVAVGAGKHVDQKITYVAGLVKPIFSETVRVKYMWWDDLVSKLKEHNVPKPHASGFPGDKKKTNINLGNTPRIGEYIGQAFPRQPVSHESYLRV
jgi:hypothetical protein